MGPVLRCGEGGAFVLIIVARTSNQNHPPFEDHEEWATRRFQFFSKPAPPARASSSYSVAAFQLASTAAGAWHIPVGALHSDDLLPGGSFDPLWRNSENFFPPC